MATIPPPHAADRSGFQRFMRYFGAMIVGFGVVLTAVGSISLFSSWGFIGGSKYYWAAYLGIPLIAVGSGLAEFENLARNRRKVLGRNGYGADGSVSMPRSRNALISTGPVKWPAYNSGWKPSICSTTPSLQIPTTRFPTERSARSPPFPSIREFCSWL